ncbi:hypothetical protein HK103_003899 [Boothiomyces macroporosus]|uniref:Uncharacterized protein n=1 Tax=Boothiomyces macroporosus TaxID=261099 RepID=A0AAD5UMB3_9FUNG|nr:hypothetical protein HK103_003899 [Boothiomyces macroporosus]
MDIRPSLPVRNSTYTKQSPTKTEDLKRLNTFLYTPKRLFPGDHIRTNTITQFDANPQVEDLLVNSTGLKRSSTLKDLRRHVRDRTKNPDDAASVDSSKSTREDAANKIKTAFSELEALKRKNEELEKKLSKYEMKSDNKESNVKQIWDDIQEMTSSMMKELKLSRETKDKTHEEQVKEAVIAKTEKPPNTDSEKLHVKTSKTASPKLESTEIEKVIRKQAWVEPLKPEKIQDSTDTLDAQDPDLSSQFHSDMLKMMTSFGF